jgi:hypothetical protein
MDAEKQKAESGREHQKRATLFNAAEQKVSLQLWEFVCVKPSSSPSSSITIIMPAPQPVELALSRIPKHSYRHQVRKIEGSISSDFSFTCP